MVTFFNTVQSFVQFLLNHYLQGGALVDQNTANLRAAICAGCHNNKPTSEIKKGGCSSCNKMGGVILNTIRGKIIKGNKTTSDPKLLACALCGCDLKIKVWIPLEVLGQTKEEANAWPSFCWRKKILENQQV